MPGCATADTSENASTSAGIAARSPGPSTPQRFPNAASIHASSRSAIQNATNAPSAISTTDFQTWPST